MIGVTELALVKVSVHPDPPLYRIDMVEWPSLNIEHLTEVVETVIEFFADLKVTVMAVRVDWTALADTLCCSEMVAQVCRTCDDHPDTFYCPDQIIAIRNGSKGLIVHDGGTSVIGIRFCPWCGR